MPPVTPRVDVNKESVDNAKQAMMLRQFNHAADGDDDLERISFSSTLSTAARIYKKKMVRLLTQAGLREHKRLQKKEKRPRRVDDELWGELGNIAQQQGISRMDVVRALLTLLGDEYHHWQEKQEGHAADSVPVKNTPELLTPGEPTVAKRPRKARNKATHNVCFLQ
jgi:hypothetical protein